MIIDAVDAKSLATEELPELNLARLGIDPVHYEAIELACRDLARQGVAVKIVK